jgi:hypothetical protein
VGSFARGKLRRLEREAKGEGVILRLRNGGTKVFSDLDVFWEMFLAKTDLLVRGESRSSEVLDAVREATPESRRAFEEEYGSIEMVGRIVAGDHQGGWVDEYRLLEDGTVETFHYEGGSEEAERIRQEATQRGPAF